MLRELQVEVLGPWTCPEGNLKVAANISVSNAHGKAESQSEKQKLLTKDIK